MKSIIDPPSPPPYPDSSRTRNAVSAQLLQLPSCSQRCTARTARALAGKYTICCCTQAVQGQGRLSDPARWVAASLRILSAVGRSSVRRACSASASQCMCDTAAEPPGPPDKPSQAKARNLRWLARREHRSRQTQQSVRVRERGVRHAPRESAPACPAPRAHFRRSRYGRPSRR